MPRPADVMQSPARYPYLSVDGRGRLNIRDCSVSKKRRDDVAVEFISSRLFHEYKARRVPIGERRRRNTVRVE